MNLALSLVVHLLGVIMWMTGLLGMSRAMMVHAKESAAARPALSHLEGRLHIFALVGAILALTSGLYQLSLWGMALFKHTRWMHHKLTALIVLFIVHGLLWSTQRKWARLGPEAQLPVGRAAGLHGTVSLLLLAILAIVFIGKLT